MLVDAEFLLRKYPFSFCLSVERDVTLHVENKTKDGKSFNWIADFKLQKFRLEPRARGVPQDLMTGKYKSDAVVAVIIVRILFIS